MEEYTKEEVKVYEDILKRFRMEDKVKKRESTIMKSLWMILIILFFYNAISFGLNILFTSDDLVIKYMVSNIGWMVIAIGMIFILKTKELK